MPPLASQRRMRSRPDVSAGSLHRFLARHVEPGATVITVGWMGCQGITGPYQGQRRNQRAARGDDPGKLLPGSTGSPRWPGAGCRAPARLGRGRAPAELPITSSASASTGVGPAAGAWSSAACSSSPPAAILCATGPWSLTRAGEDATHRAGPGSPAEL